MRTTLTLLAALLLAPLAALLEARFKISTGTATAK